MSSVFKDDGWLAGFNGEKLVKTGSEVNDAEFTEGFHSGISDRIKCDGVIALMWTLLDGESEPPLYTFEDFNDWFEGFLTYEAWDTGEAVEDDDRILALAYAFLCDQAGVEPKQKTQVSFPRMG